MSLKNLEKLKYMPTFTIPTVFTNALSYTEMIGKMTIAVNECIESIEAFGKEVEEKLNAQDSEIEQVEQMFTNFKSDINGAITNAVDYMKNNIEVVTQNIVETALANETITAKLNYNADTKALTLNIGGVE